MWGLIGVVGILVVVMCFFLILEVVDNLFEELEP